MADRGSDVTRLLVAGTGLIGHRHLAHIEAHPDLVLAGIVDPVAERRAHSTAPGFASFDDVDITVDGVVIATPTETHAPLAISAAARGWHALVEKPLADSLEAADAMIAAAREAGTEILVGHHRRHHPRVARLKELIAGGSLGRPVAGALLWLMRKPDDYFDPGWRAGMNGAPVKQNLIHDVDTLRHVLGEIADVTGAGGNPVRGAARTESGGAVLTFVSGAIITIAFADTTPTPWGFEAGTGESPAIPETGQTSFFLACTKGGIEFPTMRVWSGAESWTDRPEPRDLAFDTAVPLVRQLEHFADVIAGTASPLVDATDARATLEATLRIEAVTRPEGIAP
ncbi:MAG: Gfo/Idh/MocA family oxidoreductase [Pseudomonadota bacterium]